MTRRRVLLLGSVAVVAALALTAWAVWPRQPLVITEANILRIKEGMTRAEVEAILGGRARNDVGRAAYGSYPDGLWASAVTHGAVQEWIGPEYAVGVVFRDDDRVLLVMGGRMMLHDETLVQRLLRWLHL